MSAASSSTVGSALSDFMTDTAAGPPAPVIRTRVLRPGRRDVSATGTCHLRVWAGTRPGRLGTGISWGRLVGARRGMPRQPGGGHVGTLPDHLERLRVPALAEPRPVPGGGLDEVWIKVGTDLDLGPESVQRGELLLDVVIDGHEPGGPEVHGRGRRLKAVDRPTPRIATMAARWVLRWSWWTSWTEWV